MELESGDVAAQSEETLDELSYLDAKDLLDSFTEKYMMMNLHLEIRERAL